MKLQKEDYEWAITRCRLRARASVACVRACECARVCVRARACVSVCVCMFACVRARVSSCVCACLRVCARARSLQVGYPLAVKRQRACACVFCTLHAAWCILNVARCFLYDPWYASCCVFEGCALRALQAPSSMLHSTALRVSHAYAQQAACCTLVHRMLYPACCTLHDATCTLYVRSPCCARARCAALLAR